jgi:ankyrin repeat protein
VKFLVGSGFMLNQNFIAKKSPLYVACEYGHLELAKYLIQRFEINPNLQCEDSHKTALFVAAEKGFTPIVEELIKRPDIDVNKMTSGKKTALYVAIERGYIDCVRHILRRCKLADLYLETSFSTTPLYIA